ncbi:lysoplasmalogenase family protein [Knoellia sp. LjRoot47]|uniref:lysoplasmalogenase family protein n=1 Tax=Knoellia sp. LjRoot47 TaxID=3342330 RepID=UPI003ECD82F6
MRARGLLAFVPAAVVTTAAAVAGRERTHLASKLLLAPSLAAGVVATRGARSTSRTATLVAALVGSTVGDWFMNASSRAGDAHRQRALLQRGAAGFAVQQAGLVRLLLADGARPRALPTAVVGSTLVGLAVVDTEGGARPDLVLTAYGMLLGSMAALATSSGRRSVGWGGALFLLSDATIIVGEHVAKTPRQRAVVSGTIMATYAAALALLVHGLRDEPAPLDPVQPDPVPEDPTA